MDKTQFERELLALKDDGVTDIDIVEEGNKEGNDDDDGEKEDYKSTPNIYDLPRDMLWEILQPLDGYDLLYIVRTHQNLLYATKHLKDKYFSYVKCVASAEWDSPHHTYTPEALEILLHGARVERLDFDSAARPLDVDGLKLSILYFFGSKQDDNVASAIEKLKPNTVRLQAYESYTMTPRLSQALFTISRLSLGDVGMEMLDLMLQWKGESVECIRNLATNHEGSPLFFDAIRQLLDERMNGVPTPFQLYIRFKPPLLPDQLHENILGPDYPLVFNGLSYFCGLNNPSIYIHIAPDAMYCRLS